MSCLVSSDLFKEAKKRPEDELYAQSRMVRWKLDCSILLMIGTTHGFQFLDKSSLSIASAYNLRADLHLTGQDFSWAGAVFNFGFLFWSLPANYLLQRFPIAKCAGCHLLLWGLIMMLHATAFNYGSLVAVRFFLGMAEAGLAPLAVHYLSMFYTRREMPLRMCIILSFNGLFYILSALMGYGLGHATSASVPPWKLVYLTYGSLNFAWGVVFLIVMPDEPARARFLSHEQKVVAVWRVAKNMVGLKEPHFKKSQVYEAIQDPKVWIITLLGLGIGTPLGGVTTFMSSLIEGFGFSGIEAVKYQLPIGAIAFAGTILCGTFATIVPNTRCLTIILISIVPFGCLLGLRFLPRDDQWSLLGCSWTQLLALSPNCLTWAIMTANIAGNTKRTFTSGMFFTFFAAGNIVGNKIFFSYQRPLYYSAIDGLLACYAGIMVLAAMLWALMYLDNRSRRNRLASKGEDEKQTENEAILGGLKDQTDKESLHFRYTY